MKVKEVTPEEEKSTQEREADLLAKAESDRLAAEGVKDESEAAAAEAAAAEAAAAEAAAAGAKPSFEEGDILSFIKDKYGREASSIEELIAERGADPDADLSEDVKVYLKYKKETGRGFEDFAKLNRDYDKMDENTLLSEYYKATKKGLDAEDIDYLMDKFNYDEDIDDDSEVRGKKIAKKQTVANAKEFFEKQKEAYKVPLESSGARPEETEEYKQVKRYMDSLKTQEEEIKVKKDWFDKKTKEVYNEGFKGFEFEIGDEKITYSPGDANEILKKNPSVNTFISDYLDDNGLLKDESNFHRSLSVAMNPEKFAQFFFEQGKAKATDGNMRNLKNTDMAQQRIPESTSKGGVTARSLDDNSGNGLKIRSKRK